MTRTKRLEPVLKHTDNKEQQALQALASSQTELEVENTRLSQLKSYKNEYHQKQSDKNYVYSAMELQEFNRFLSQLDQTIEQQQKVVQMRKGELDGKRRAWQATRIDSKKIQKIVENLQQQEQIREARNEQKIMDEFSQMKFQKT